MDGVLIDSEPAYLEMNLKLFKKLGIDIKEDEYKKFVGMDSRKMWTEIKNKFDLEQSADELRLTEKKLMKDVLMSDAVSDTIEGVHELLSEFKNNKFKLSLASSSSRENIEVVVNKLKLFGHFDFIISGDEVKNGKPEPDIFLTVSDKFNLPANKCIVIEDSHNGVRAARKAGMHCIGFKNNDSGNQDLSEADLIVNSFTGSDYFKIINFINSI